MSTPSPPRGVTTRARSRAVTPAGKTPKSPKTPRTPNNNYLANPYWCEPLLVAAGNEHYLISKEGKDLRLVKFIKAAAEDGHDFQAMRPKELDEKERHRRDMAWDRYAGKLRKGGKEAKDLLSDAANTLALHNASVLRAHGAILRAHGVDIEDLYGITEAHGASIKTLYGRFGMLTGAVFLLSIFVLHLYSLVDADVRHFVVGWVPFFARQNATMPSVVEDPPASAFGNDGGEFGSALVSKRIGEDEDESNALVADASFYPTPLSSEADDDVLQGQEESVEEENVADDKLAGGIGSDSAGNDTPAPVDQDLSPSFTTTEAADEIVASRSGEDVVDSTNGSTCSREVEMDNTEVDAEPSHRLSIPSALCEPTSTMKDKPPTDEVSDALADSADGSHISPGVDGGIIKAQPARSEEEEGLKSMFMRIFMSETFRKVVLLILFVDVIYVLGELFFWSGIQY